MINEYLMYLSASFWKLWNIFITSHVRTPSVPRSEKMSRKCFTTRSPEQVGAGKLGFYMFLPNSSHVPSAKQARESEKNISPWPRHDMLANFARRTVRLIFLFLLRSPAHPSIDPFRGCFVLCRTSVDVRHSKDMPQCLLKITVAI